MNERDKIIAQIAAVEQPLYDEDQQVQPMVYCHYCDANKELFLEEVPFEHDSDCVWERSRKLAGFKKRTTIYKHWVTLEQEANHAT